MYTLYVIPASHACRSAILMFERKRVAYRRVDSVPGLHPGAVRRRGFRPRETRVAGGRRPLVLRLGDRLGTVPALAANGQRVSTNRDIARFLDERHPEPRLLPADPERRRAVEQAERWANDVLQMEARRILLAAALNDGPALSRAAADGRMGCLLYRRRLARRLVIPVIGRFAFAVERGAERDPVAELPALLDRVDAFIADGVIGGDEPNAADFMVAPCLALILYRPDVRPMFEGRPALELVDRLLPEPA